MLSKASLMVILPLSLDKTKCSSFIGLFGWWWINGNTSHGNSTYYFSVIIVSVYGGGGGWGIG